MQELIDRVEWRVEGGRGMGKGEGGRERGCLKDRSKGASSRD